MTDTETRALALGHVRNAVWQLMGNDHPDGLRLGMKCLDLEALLNPDDIEPDVVPVEATAATSLLAARDRLAVIIDQVAPAAWAELQSLLTELG